MEKTCPGEDTEKGDGIEEEGRGDEAAGDLITVVWGRGLGSVGVAVGVEVKEVGGRVGWLGEDEGLVTSDDTTLWTDIIALEIRFSPVELRVSLAIAPVPEQRT